MKFTKTHRYASFLCVTSFVCLVMITWLNEYHNTNTNKPESDENAMFSLFANQSANVTDKLSVFFRIHETILRQNDSSKKKIVFNGGRDGRLAGSPTGGYGNRLYSALSSMLIALLLDSQLSIRWTNIHAFIETPLVDLFDMRVNEREGISFFEYRFESFYFRGLQPYEPNKNIERLMRTHVPYSYLRYFIDYADPLFMEICTNSKYYRKILFYDLARKQTIDAALNITTLDSSQDRLG